MLLTSLVNCDCPSAFVSARVRVKNAVRRRLHVPRARLELHGEFHVELHLRHHVSTFLHPPCLLLPLLLWHVIAFLARRSVRSFCSWAASLLPGRASPACCSPKDIGASFLGMFGQSLEFSKQTPLLWHFNVYQIGPYFHVCGNGGTLQVGTREGWFCLRLLFPFASPSGSMHRAPSWHLFE